MEKGKNMISFITSGKSHGKGLFATVRGIPAGLSIKKEDINVELRRRQAGYGRSSRMGIEKDKVDIAIKEIERLNPDRLKYEILITDRDKIGFENINKVKEVIYEYKTK